MPTVPTIMQDVGLNAILQRGSDDLIALAEQLGYDDGIAELKQGRDRMAKAFAGLWLEDKHSFVCRDLVADKQVPVTTTGGSWHCTAVWPATNRRKRWPR